MAIILSFPQLTSPEIRTLQEFRRVGTESLSLAAIKAIKHPYGGGEAPAFALVEKGYLIADDARQNFTLTEKGREFLTIDPKPLVESGTADSAAPE